MAIFIPFVRANVVTFPGITSERVKQFFSPIHFVGGGNDFGGGFFGIGTKDRTQTISLNGETITCKRQIIGFYFNSQRGNRLWPLDQETLNQLKGSDQSYARLTLEGGIFTNCEGPGIKNVYGRYGIITYNQGGSRSQLIAGTKINRALNTITPTFAHSLENFDNKSLIGWLYDSIGGRGMVGGPLTASCYDTMITAINDNQTINQIFTLDNNGIITMTNNQACRLDEAAKETALGQILGSISVNGNIALTRSISATDRASIQGNNNQRTIVQNTTVSIANVLGSTRRTSEGLCRGKRRNSAPLLGTNNENTICVDFGSYQETNRVMLNASDLSTISKRTLIIKNGNLVINGIIPQNSELNVFIDNGNLLLAPAGGNTLQFFDHNGYLLANSNNHTARGQALRGNFIINGLFLGYNTNTNTIQSFPHKVYIYGKLASLNTPVAPTPERIQQVERLTATKNHTNKINFSDAFTWSCNPGTSQGSDGTPCGSSNDKHTFSPLIVIDSLFESPRF
ncbi:MAG: hypothetical protein NZL83_00090 [Candidatus Absconditabacterales bacterium]|nr:hypothetical protein [Candidatus Absconditabacterales bacterium]